VTVSNAEATNPVAATQNRAPADEAAIQGAEPEKRAAIDSTNPIADVPTGEWTSSKCLSIHGTRYSQHERRYGDVELFAIAIDHLIFAVH